MQTLAELICDEYADFFKTAAHNEARHVLYLLGKDAGNFLRLSEETQISVREKGYPYCLTIAAGIADSICVGWVEHNEDSVRATGLRAYREGLKSAIYGRLIYISVNGKER